jgi:hypothetical protein
LTPLLSHQSQALHAAPPRRRDERQPTLGLSTRPHRVTGAALAHRPPTPGQTTTQHPRSGRIAHTDASPRHHSLRQRRRSQGNSGVWGVPAALPRSLRGRPSQVKGAFGVAEAMPLRGTLDLRASTAPPGSVAGRPKALPSTTRGSAAGTPHTPRPRTYGPLHGPGLPPNLRPRRLPTAPKTDKNNKQQRSATPTH